MAPSKNVAATVSFLHTSSVHIDTFQRLLSARLPGVAVSHLVDESLLADARRYGITDALALRVSNRLHELTAQSPALIVCTCSTIGALAEAIPIDCTVIRVDRPMAERAISIANRTSGAIGVAAALASTIEPTRALLQEAAQSAGVDTPAVVPIPCYEAWNAFERGDLDTYAQAIAATVRPVAVAHHFAVIVLAQASMAPARLLLTDLTTPILTSPDLLVDAIADRLERSNQVRAFE